MTPLNEAIVSGLRTIQAFPNFSGSGNGFDNTCAKVFLASIQKLKAYTVEELSAEECRKIRDSKPEKSFRPLLKPYLAKISKKDYDFSKISEPLPPDEVYVLRQPCGSQNWPDLVILNHKTGLPVEFKSSKDSNKIVWNSNYPRNGIYIFNGKHQNPDSNKHSTFFLAEDVIGSCEVAAMADCRKGAEKLASDTNEVLSELKSMWTVYLRPMHNWGDPLLDSPHLVAREEKVLSLAANFFPGPEPA